MIGYIDELYRDLAYDLRRSYEQYPPESMEYKIWMQDISSAPAHTIVPDIEFTDESTLQLYDILYTMPHEYLQFFYEYYVRRCNRKKKMEALGLKTKDEFYRLRDSVHSYTQYRLDTEPYSGKKVPENHSHTAKSKVECKKAAGTL